jgi:hypothetical protein
MVTMHTKEFDLLTLMVSKVVNSSKILILSQLELGSSQVCVNKRVKTGVPFFEG